MTITLQADVRELFDSLKDKEVNVEIKKASKHRSMDANAYLWHLCGEIAKASSKFSNEGKNDVYREAIQAKGEYEPLLVREEAVDYFIHKWSEKGVGWFAEVIDDYIMPDDYSDMMGDNKERYKTVHAYYGSSTYDSLSMSRVIDYVVNMANDLNIPTVTPAEEMRLLELWNKKKGES